MDIKTLTGASIRTDGTSSAVKPRTSTIETSSDAIKTGQTNDEPVTLTATARTLNAARDTAGTIPFNREKVAEIKAAVAEGRYTIDNQRLAGRLLNFEGQFARP